MVSLAMQSFSIITTLLRKVTEYVMSTLLTLKKLKIKNTVLTILHKESNTTFWNLIIITPIHNQNSTRDSKTKTYTYPHPPLSKTYIHGTVEAEEEPGISNCMATSCMVEKQGHWKANWHENVRKISICKNKELFIPNLYSLYHT